MLRTISFIPWLSKKGNVLQHQEMGQSRRSLIVKVNLQIGRQVFLPREKIFSNVIAQPLEIMSRNIGATVPREMSVAEVYHHCWKTYRIWPMGRMISHSTANCLLISSFGFLNPCCSTTDFVSRPYGYHMLSFAVPRSDAGLGTVMSPALVRKGRPR